MNERRRRLTVTMFDWLVMFQFSFLAWLRKVKLHLKINFSLWLVKLHLQRDIVYEKSEEI